MTTSLEQIPVKTIDGQPSSLGAYEGKVRLVVNVASKCGFTPQYEGLEALYRKYKDRGFEVLGFPANEFGAQEPGTEEEIKTFCSTKYEVSFPMFAKIVVKGEGQNPLYAQLTTERPALTDGEAFKAKMAKYGVAADSKDVSWNFEKFLVGRDGKVADRFAPDMAPDSPVLAAAIEKALG